MLFVLDIYWPSARNIDDALAPPRPRILFDTLSIHDVSPAGSSTNTLHTPSLSSSTMSSRLDKECNKSRWNRDNNGRCRKNRRISFCTVYAINGLRYSVCCNRRVLENAWEEFPSWERFLQIIHLTKFMEYFSKKVCKVVL